MMMMLKLKKTKFYNKLKIKQFSYKQILKLMSNKMKNKFLLEIQMKLSKKLKNLEKKEV